MCREHMKVNNGLSLLCIKFSCVFLSVMCLASRITPAWTHTHIYDFGHMGSILKVIQLKIMRIIYWHKCHTCRKKRSQKRKIHCWCPFRISVTNRLRMTVSPNLCVFKQKNAISCCFGRIHHECLNLRFFFHRIQKSVFDLSHALSLFLTKEKLLPCIVHHWYMATTYEFDYWALLFEAVIFVDWKKLPRPTERILLFILRNV